jgi:pimeloyl-ACP methyl ester carboxylesterase
MTRRLGLLAALLIALAGCGSHHDARKQATPTGTAGARACSDPDERTHAIRLRTSDGVSLAGAVIGAGPVGAVLIHEYPLDHCGWRPYARYLSRHGVRALMLDLRCFGHSACPGGRGQPVTDVAAAVVRFAPVGR